MAKEQVKFYVTDKEKERLTILANARFMTISAYVKLTALGVKIQQIKEIYIPSETEVPSPAEKIVYVDVPSSPRMLDDASIAMLREIQARKQGPDYLQYDRDFNMRLFTMVERLLDAIDQEAYSTMGDTFVNED